MYVRELDIRLKISTSSISKGRDMSSFINFKHLRFITDIFNKVIGSKIYNESFLDFLDSYNVYCGSSFKDFDDNIYFIMLNLYLKNNNDYYCQLTIFENEYILDFYKKRTADKSFYTYKSNNIDNIAKANKIIRYRQCLL